LSHKVTIRVRVLGTHPIKATVIASLMESSAGWPEAGRFYWG
jgi:hypothetical protein